MDEVITALRELSAAVRTARCKLPLTHLDYVLEEPASFRLRHSGRTQTPAAGSGAVACSPSRFFLGLC